MGNALYSSTTIGTIGEILVQLRLLELGVQAAPPIKDSGNDLIAIRGEIVKYLQIKTGVNHSPNTNNLPDIYHFLFKVILVKEDGNYMLDKSTIEVFDYKGQDKGKLNKKLVDEIWL